jgi:NADPH2:quinone reductase
VVSMEDPRPGPDEVLVAVPASSVTPLDTYLRRGIPVGDYTPTPPYVPGAAFAGVVVETGADVRNVAVGERVYGRARSGSAAELAVCASDQAFALPDTIGFDDGALIAVPFETAWYGLVDLGRAAGGETVLVHGGAGSVGAATVQIARARGLRVIATCSGADREAVLAVGAHVVLDYRDPGLKDRLAAAASGGVDVVVDVAARTNLALDIAICAPGGRIVIVGGTGPTPFDALPIIAKGLTIAGVDLRALTPRRRREIHAGIAAGLEAGILRPRASHRFGLDEAGAAHEAVEAGRGSGGVVLLVNGTSMQPGSRA